MTRKSFYRALSRIAKKFKWRVQDGYLRAYKNDEEFCPLQAYLYENGRSTNYYAEKVVQNEDTAVIEMASDRKLKHLETVAERRCRKALFNAVGLKKGL